MFKRFVFAAIFAGTIGPLTPVNAQENPGAYLAARAAGAAHDYEAALLYFSESLIMDPTNPFLLENVLIARVSLGDIDGAVPVAQTIVDNGIESQMAHLVLSAHAAKSDDWMHIFEALEAGQTVGPLVDGLSQAWAYVGLGQISKALQSFDEAIDTPGVRAYGLYSKALALASVGDFGGADAILGGGPETGLRYNARSAVAHAQILSQLDRNEDAVALIDGVFGDNLDPTISVLRAQLDAGDTIAFSTISSPLDGLAEVTWMVAEALPEGTPRGYILMYARITDYLKPEFTTAILLSANLLDEMEQFTLANAAYARVARHDPAFQHAELGRAQSLSSAGRTDAAIEVVTALSRSHADQPIVHATLGEMLRRDDQMPEAIAAYSRAIDLFPNNHPQKWFTYYSRAIAAHLTDDWSSAEADFRAALALNPDQAQVLNYLGYSLVERGEKLDEALTMIETAAGAHPENGAIVDSLGWVLFQLERYEEAVIHMEQAVVLEAVDPIINDHLGDVYWSVGRDIEAQFQWQRALSFDPTEADATRIRRKIEVGLNIVLEEEGANPIRISHDTP